MYTFDYELITIEFESVACVCHVFVIVMCLSCVSHVFFYHCLGCLSVTNSNPLGKLDVPVKEWPIAPFPQLEYPAEVWHTLYSRNV